MSDAIRNEMIQILPRLRAFGRSLTGVQDQADDLVQVTVEKALRHIITRLTDEGLVIELFDLPDAQLFEDNSDTPRPVTSEIGAILALLFNNVSNPIAIKGHLRRNSVLQLDNPVWELSTGRAAQMRLLLEAGGLPPLRIARLTGAADRVPVVRDATAIRNNRIELVLLRSDR